MYNVGMSDRGHDLDLAPNADEVGFRLDLAFLDSLDRHFLTSLLVDTQLNFAICSLAQLSYYVESETIEIIN